MTTRADTIASKLGQLPPQWVAAVVGCLFSLWWMFKYPVLNDDAYQYLRAAELFNSDGAHAVYSHYGWFNYSILIALLNKVLPGGLLTSARILNLALQTLLMVSFVTLSQRLRPGRRTAWLAALTLLAYPQLNEARFMLIRDFGFWAFALVSLQQLLQFRDNGRWPHALAWVLALAMATLFRLEALLLVALTPLALLGNGNTRKMIKLYALLIAITALISLACALLQVDLLAQMKFAYRYYLPLIFDLPASLGDAAQSLMQKIFAPDNYPGSNNAGVGIVILLFGYIYSVLANVVQALSVPVSVLLVHAAWRGWLRPVDGWRGPQSLYALSNLLGLLAFMTIMHFITERYTMLLCLLLLLQVPTVLNRWIEHAQTLGNPLRYRLLAGFFVVYFFTDSLVSFGYSRQYMAEGLHWLQTHQREGSALLSNSPYLAYGSGRIVDYDAVSVPISDLLSHAASGNVLALSLKVYEHDARALLEQDHRLMLLEQFANNRDDEVRIYLVQ